MGTFTDVDWGGGGRRGGGWSHAVSRSWVIYFVLPWPRGHSTRLHVIKFDMGMLNVRGVFIILCCSEMLIYSQGSVRAPVNQVWVYYFFY